MSRALDGGTPMGDRTMRHMASIFVLLALAGAATAETATRDQCRSLIGLVQAFAAEFTPTIETITKGEETMKRVMKVTSGDLKRAFEVNDQARIAWIKSMIAYRDTLEDLGRQLQICAQR
jgi:hypothetical protein